MSFQLLKAEVIDTGLCLSCGLCADTCKHLVMVDKKPQIKDFCIMDKNGLACGKCFDTCPQIKQIRIKQKSPLEIVAVQTTDPDLQKNSPNGGFLPALLKYILETKTVSHVIGIKNEGGKILPAVATSSSDINNYNQNVPEMTGTLEKLGDVLADQHKLVGIVGTPCEMLAAQLVEKNLKARLYKIGLLCETNLKSSNNAKESGNNNGKDPWGAYKEIKEFENQKDKLDIKKLAEQLKKKVFCNKCSDIAGLISDLSLGVIGENKDFTTVLVWTKRGRKTIDDMLKKGLITKGRLDPKVVVQLLNEEMKQELVTNALSPREQVYNSIVYDGPGTIPEISKRLNMPTTTVRYHALRLVQLKRLGMEMPEPGENPIFSLDVKD